MATLSAVPTPTTAKLTAEQILMRMPHSSADELQAVHAQLQNACHTLQAIVDGQWFRLLNQSATAPLNKTLNTLRQAMPVLSEALALRRKQQDERLHRQKNLEYTLYQLFPALGIVTAHPVHKAQLNTLLEVARLILITETELHFSWLVTPDGHSDFFEQEPSRLLSFLQGYLFQACETGLTGQDFHCTVQTLKKRLSRPLNKPERAVFKRIQEALAIERSDNVVRLNSNRKPIQQGEHP